MTPEKIKETKAIAFQFLQEGGKILRFGNEIAKTIGCSVSMVTNMKKGKRSIKYEWALLIIKHSPKLIKRLSEKKV